MRICAFFGLALALLLCAVGRLPAAEDDGALRPEFTESLRGSVKLDGPTRALYNAVTGNDAKRLVISRDIVQKSDDLFNHRVTTKGVTDQKGSQRCWMFAAMNIMRPAVIEKFKLDGFEFSISYFSFWDRLEKANFFLETMIDMRDRDPSDREFDYFVKDPIPEGGWWCFAVALIEKYGVVPKDAMPETFPAEHSDVLGKVLELKLRVSATKLRQMAAEKKSVRELREAKQKMLAEIYRILVLNYGEPPKEFVYRYADRDKKISEPKKFTPQSFYKEWVGVDLSQYVQLANDPTLAYGKLYRLQRVRNMVNGPEVSYVNVPIDVLKSVTAKSISDGHGVVFSCDMGKDVDIESGILQDGFYDFGSLYGVDLKLSKADRLRTHGGSPNHAMTFIGVDILDGKPTKWLVENSWGSQRGKNGLLTMHDKWYEEHVFDAIVRKAYVPNDILKAFQGPAVELPPWASLNGNRGG